MVGGVVVGGAREVGTGFARVEVGGTEVTGVVVGVASMPVVGVVMRAEGGRPRPGLGMTVRSSRWWVSRPPGTAAVIVSG